MKIALKFELLLQNIYFKRLIASFIIALTFVGYGTVLSKKVYADLEEGIIRFHCVANSDSEYDQALKLKVRDAVTSTLTDKLKDVKDVEKSRAIIRESLEEIEGVAKKVLKENGCDLAVKANVGVSEFPEKAYGAFRLPKGEYYALKVVIGKGEGKNWWCVLYPDLCFGILTEEKLKNAVSDETVYVLKDNRGYSFKFLLLELFGK